MNIMRTVIYRKETQERIRRADRIETRCNICRCSIRRSAVSMYNNICVDKLFTLYNDIEVSKEVHTR